MQDVNDDIICFTAKNDLDRVLVFPPVSNYRRFLIHKCVEDLGLAQLSTFSIGVGDERRTVVCFADQLLRDIACATTTMGLAQTSREDADLTPPDGAVCRGAAKPPPPREQIRSASTKPRRPDRAVYVPRALRSDTAEDKANARKRSGQITPPVAKCPKAVEKPPPPETPKRAAKGFCNVYTPPALRNHRQTEQVPSDSATQCSDDDSANEASDNFYIGDYFAKGQLGLYNPNLYYGDYTDDIDGSYNRSDNTNGCVDANVELNDINELNMSLTQANPIINTNYGLHYDKDEDAEKKELQKASEEINRSSKRIIKQTFHSNVLVISDPVEEPPLPTPLKKEIPIVKEEVQIVKKKLEPRVSLKREENDWDAVFDDSGECLDPSLLEELSATVGKVHITKAKNNYDQYQTKGQALFNGPIDESLAHVVEVYDFSSEFKTNDLLSVFSEYKDTGFEIKWVDDTHALIVFSSAKIAAEVLASQRSLVRCRPLSAATLESRNKAKKCAEFLQPYRQRPETCTALARRLVSGALGVRLSTASEERAEERRLLTAAREKKRQAALHKEAAWDGSLANTTPPDA